jgi:uncharacterized repeat protein (TIGR02543 family)
MNAARTVNVTYTAATYTVTYNANGGTGAASPASQNKTHDINLTPLATQGTLARTGYTFAGWNTAANGTGTDYPAGASGTYTANAAVTLYAKWTINAYTLTAAKGGGGSGTISNPPGINCGADCSEAYTFGTMVQLSAAPAGGSTFTGWSGGGCSGTGTCTVTMTGPLTVTATFASLPDLSATNNTPVDGAVYPGPVTFTGSAVNSAAASVGAGLWADVEIDWGSDGSYDNFNAFNDNSLEAFSPSDSQALTYTYNSPPIGNHQYRFNVDTNDMLTEADEGNNQSAWVPFTVASGWIDATDTTPSYGATTTISWDSQGLAGLGCTVSGGGDSWNIDDISSPQDSSVIFASRTYTLGCNGYPLFTLPITVDMTPTLTSTSTRVDAGSVVRLNYDTKDQTCTLTAPGQGQVTGVGYADVTVNAMTTYRLMCPDENNEARLRIEITPRIIET